MFKKISIVTVLLAMIFVISKEIIAQQYYQQQYPQQGYGQQQYPQQGYQQKQKTEICTQSSACNPQCIEMLAKKIADNARTFLYKFNNRHNIQGAMQGAHKDLLDIQKLSQHSYNETQKCFPYLR